MVERNKAGNQYIEDLKKDLAAQQAEYVKYKAGAVTDILREMGLFGSYTPKREDKLWYPITVMSQALYIETMSEFKTGYEQDLGKRLSPHRKTLIKLEMAYEINAYPALRDTGYGLETSEIIRDAHDNAGIDIGVYPYRAPIVLNDPERIILGTITRDRGLPFDPEKREYRYTDLLPQLNDRGEKPEK